MTTAEQYELASDTCLLETALRKMTVKEKIQYRGTIMRIVECLEEKSKSMPDVSLEQIFEYLCNKYGVK